MAEALALQGCEVHVITYHLGSQSIDESKLPFKIHRILNVPTYRNCFPGPNYQKLLVLDFLLLIKVLKFLSKMQIDIIHAHHYEGLLIALAARKFKRYPIIYDAHTLLSTELPSYDLGLTNRMKKKLGKYLDEHLPQQADFILAVSEDLKRSLLTGGKVLPEKIAVVTNGIEAEFLNVHPRNQSVHIKKILYAGNLGKFQGIDCLLKCFRHVLDFRKDVLLNIVTDCSFKPYQSLVDELDIRKYIRLIPSKLEDLHQHLADADILINPRAKCDGISQKLFNYMAVGKPIVSFEGSAKILRHQENGWIVAGDNHQKLAEAVLHLLENDERCRRIGANARALVKKYSWEMNAIKAIHIYEKVVSYSTNEKVHSAGSCLASSYQVPSN